MKKSMNMTLAFLGLVSFAGLASGQVAGVYPSGLLHTPHGAAQLGPVDGRRLPVNNLGSSGQDGVEVHLSSASGGGVTVEAEPFLSTPGATLRESWLLQKDGLS